MLVAFNIPQPHSLAGELQFQFFCSTSYDASSSSCKDVRGTDGRRFMDAEIGVRNLADTFRYNVLPDVVQVLGLTDGKMGEIAESFEDLPEYERLAMLVSNQSVRR